MNLRASVCMAVLLCSGIMSCTSTMATSDTNAVEFVFVNFDEKIVSLTLDDRLIVDRQLLHDRYPEIGLSLSIMVNIIGQTEATLQIDDKTYHETIIITPETKTVYVRTIPDFFAESDEEPFLD